MDGWQQLVKDYPNDVVNQNNLNRILHPQPAADDAANEAAPTKSNLKAACMTYRNIMKVKKSVIDVEVFASSSSDLNDGLISTFWLIEDEKKGKKEKKEKKKERRKKF